MFYEGSLQEGIATAIQQSKLVVCFVTDGESESQIWETEFLVDDAIRELLSTRALMLKLQAGSTEAGYLAAIFPLPKTPTLVIMYKGELKEYIAAGVSKEDFISRTAKALGAASQQQPPAASASAQPTSPPPAATPAPAPAPSSSPAPPAATPQPSPQVQALLSERAARLEAIRAQRQKEESEQRRKDKGKGKASSDSSSKPRDPAQEKYSAELKQRQQQAREDRARVLQAIADDKAARRAKVSEREAERARAAGAPVSVLPEEERKGERGGNGGDGGWCKLQIRLFDGSTVRGQFEGGQSLGGDVRKWLEEQQQGMKGLGGAYGFKVILTPKPSKTIEAGEEGKSLQELGLTPSATLVLVPVAGKGARAYPGTVGGNPVTRALMAIVGVFTGLWALIVGFLGSMFSTRPAPAAVQGREMGASGAATGRDQSRKGGLRHLRPEGEKRNEQQFYNGNSTNFEPRKDDDDEQQ